ncbi:MAG: hypothetical protein PHQ89_01075 [Bacilli bacterium]|nr:hypothetical protein [Bacilli bacterium]
METLNAILPIILYILGSVAIIVLIIIGIKLIKILSGIEDIVRDVEGKVQSLNGVFSLIDVATDKLSLLSDKIVEGISSLILRIFRKKESNESKEDKKKKDKEENENE